MDLRDFFPSTTRERVRRIFGAVGYPERVASTLAALCTVVAPLHVRRQAGPSDRLAMQRFASAHLPQGAPTSPALANLAARSLDVRLAAAAAASGAVYTRYADDLAFSGGPAFAERARGFVGLVDEIVRDAGYVVHPDKTRILGQGQRQILGGVVVNAHPNVPRDEYDRLKAVLHHCVRSGPAGQNRDGHPNFRPPRGADRLGRPAEPGAGGEAPDDVRPDRVGARVPSPRRVRLVDHVPIALHVPLGADLVLADPGVAVAHRVAALDHGALPDADDAAVVALVVHDRLVPERVPGATERTLCDRPRSVLVNASFWSYARTSRSSQRSPSMSPTDSWRSSRIDSCGRCRSRSGTSYAISTSARPSASVYISAWSSSPEQSKSPSSTASSVLRSCAHAPLAHPIARTVTNDISTPFR